MTHVSPRGLLWLGTGGRWVPTCLYHGTLGGGAPGQRLRPQVPHPLFPSLKSHRLRAILEGSEGPLPVLEILLGKPQSGWLGVRVEMRGGVSSVSPGSSARPGLGRSPGRPWNDLGAWVQTRKFRGGHRTPRQGNCRLPEAPLLHCGVFLGSRA